MAETRGDPGRGRRRVPGSRKPTTWRKTGSAYVADRRPLIAFSSRGALQSLDARHIDFLLGAPEVIFDLHPQPNFGAVAEELADPDGGRGRDALLSRENIVEGLTRNAEKAGNLSLAFPGRGDRDFGQNLAGMRGRDRLVSQRPNHANPPHRRLSHFHRSKRR